MDIGLQEVLKELYEISGFRVSVYDLECREIASYPGPLSSFCTYIQQNANALKSCVENDQKAFKIVKEQGKPYIYRCRFGLYEAVAPLYYFDTLSGYFMMGQVLDAQSGESDRVYTMSEQFADDKQRLRDAIEALPVCSKRKLSSYLSIMSICAEYITLSNRFGPRHTNLPQNVKHYLKQHYAEKILLSELCRRFYCSKATLTHLFKQEYGETINEYLLRIRIRHAMEKLRSDGKLSQIAAECGFGEQNYFCKVFRRETGKTPTEYRRQLIEKETAFSNEVREK